MWAFYTGLGLIIAGVGMLKPNISTMVGGLYKQGDIRRDKGFTIFYIGINVGAFLSSLIVGYVGEVHGWHYGFGLAGIVLEIAISPDEYFSEETTTNLISDEGWELSKGTRIIELDTSELDVEAVVSEIQDFLKSPEKTSKAIDFVEFLPVKI